MYANSVRPIFDWSDRIAYIFTPLLNYDLE